jgi:hypothetical protein
MMTEPPVSARTVTWPTPETLRGIPKKMQMATGFLFSGTARLGFSPESFFAVLALLVPPPVHQPAHPRRAA